MDVSALIISGLEYAFRYSYTGQEKNAEALSHAG